MTVREPFVAYHSGGVFVNIFGLVNVIVQPEEF